MIYRCVGISSSITEIGAVLYDYEFESQDGSTLLLANVIDSKYMLGALYSLQLDSFIPAEAQ